MNSSTSWRPAEIIIHSQVKNDPATIFFLQQSPNVPVKFIDSGLSKHIREASKLISSCSGLLNKIMAGKSVVYIAPAEDVVDQFTMPDGRMLCPHFDRLKLASNGCFYRCDWCYLKLTYRVSQPYITIRVQHDEIKRRIQNRISESALPIMFNSGELADALSLKHLTGAMRAFIPFFGQSGNGYLFLLTKSDNVDCILDLPHNGHSIVTWSMNNEDVSRKYEIGAPSFERRLEAAITSLSSRISGEVAEALDNSRRLRYRMFRSLRDNLVWPPALSGEEFHQPWQQPLSYATPFAKHPPKHSGALAAFERDDRFGRF